MTPDTSGAAMEAAQTVFDTTRGRKFDQAVRAFERILGAVPDSAPDEISAGALQVLRHLAERVIARIEERVESEVDGQPLQLELAEHVYEIRRVLEKIDYWQRHYTVR